MPEWVVVQVNWQQYDKQLKGKKERKEKTEIVNISGDQRSGSQTQPFFTHGKE